MKGLKVLILLNAMAGIIALIAFAYFTSWQAALALFFMLWANNISEFMKKLNE